MTGLQMDEHIARIALNQGATPQVKTYLTDALGSVIATAKADQSLEVGYAFSPYGQTQKVGVENQQPGSENSSQYTGRENDNNGLYFYRARYYDPILKRFISEDPIGLAGGINSHAYVEGDPVSLKDPTGFNSMNDWNPKPRLPLVPMHPETSFRKSTLSYWSCKSTSDITDSLRLGVPESLKVDPKTGLVWNGNTRISILEKRGFDVNSLPRESYSPRGYGVRGLGILSIFGFTLDIYEMYKMEEQCKKDPCSCNMQCM
jgi:RHS repeat-associated protein